MDDEIRSSIDESLKRKHGKIVGLQVHNVPEWFGKGWLVSFELPEPTSAKTSVIGATLFHDENGKPVLAREFVVKDADGNYPQWKSLAGDGKPGKEVRRA